MYDSTPTTIERQTVRIAELSGHLAHERREHQVTRSLLIDDYESLRTKAIRELQQPMNLLADVLLIIDKATNSNPPDARGLDASRVAIVQEFVERSLNVIQELNTKLYDSAEGWNGRKDHVK